MPITSVSTGRQISPIVRIYYRLTDHPSPYSNNALGTKKIESYAGATVPVTEPGPYYNVDTTHAQPQLHIASVMATSRLRITSNSTIAGLSISERLRTQPAVGRTQATSLASANILDNASQVTGVLSLLQ